ncbi:MAG: hypothetical protein PHD07_01430 [Bacteroidales bacterium]|nr:hypothetical protein [Bacteroidales bacterium]MDD3201737.1 hypothetical protein [Bacteroidales bacterium]
MTKKEKIFSAAELEHTIRGIMTPVGSLLGAAYIITMIVALVLCAISALILI